MFDYTPLYRSSVGFDRLFSLLDEAANVETQTYPPYNIERLSENSYRITMAVAGFGLEDLTITQEGNALLVTGKKTQKADPKIEVLHQGIAARDFERRFQTADHVEVTSADLVNGLLQISLVREIPEAMKPRQIAIGGTVAKAKVIEHKAA
jgi:molecular chaperone IbpA